MSTSVQVWRGGIVESTHRVIIAVCNGEGELVAKAGDVAHVTFARSAVKPMQAIPLVVDGVVSRFSITPQHLALCCASHNGEPRHVDGVLELLQRFGIAPDLLACGPHAPLGEKPARALRTAGREPERVHNNCSGKHAGMLGLALVNGWPLEGYNEIGHPVQSRMLAEMARWTGIAADSIPLAVDGCGVATFGLSVHAMASAYARLARMARDEGSAAATVLNAMGGHPEYVAGENRLCTALMRAVEGRLIAKVGAEGVYCAASPEAELGVALKVVDGATRAAEPALLATLEALDLLAASESELLSQWREPIVRNTRGEAVGRIGVVLELEAA